MKQYKDRYTYPAIFHYEDDGISISFPDLPGCLSCADTDEEGLFMAEDVLGLWMEVLEDDEEDVPEASKLVDIDVEENERVVLISVWMPMVRDAVLNKSIKKTLTIPQWLDIEAKRQDINFSHVLQKALKEELGIR